MSTEKDSCDMCKRRFKCALYTSKGQICDAYDQERKMRVGTFYMMVGLPGSGKSTYAKTIPGVVIHSSDAIREELFGDVNDQEHNTIVFNTLHKRVLGDLFDGKSVVYDATNLSSARRKAFLQAVSALNNHPTKVCIFVNTSERECIQRNAQRTRRVPIQTIHRMSAQMDFPSLEEGWDYRLTLN